MPANVVIRKETSFILWRLANDSPPPKLVIGLCQPGAPMQVINEKNIDMTRVSGFDDLWEVPAATCQLSDGQTYYYWFEITVSNAPGARRRIADPFAYMVDWRLVDPDSGAPASVVRYFNGKLQMADAGGEVGNFHNEPPPETLPRNNQIVIYELPTAWTVSSNIGGRNMGVGSFADVTALVDATAEFNNFDGFDFEHIGAQYLVDLGINAIELLPPADSIYNREWGYGTTNPFAPDYEYGFPCTYSFPTPNRDLVNLIRILHTKKIRIIVDTVMGFAKDNPCRYTAPDDFFLMNPGSHHEDPDARDSRGGYRSGWGGDLWRYARSVDDAYDPITGNCCALYPARQLLKAALSHWIGDFHIDGIRLDSVETIANWDFIEEYKNDARSWYKTRFSHPDEADSRFLVVGEELSEPLGLLKQTVNGHVHHRLDGLWHENFKKYIRYALQGKNHPDESTFEWTVRRAIDCRLFGYEDLAQAIIYLGSHDVEGERNERLVNFFWNNGISDAEKRAKLAFVCLLTAVGIPMIFAGDEFLDQHDLVGYDNAVSHDGGKQVDPVNYSRLSDDWRIRVKEHIARLISLRTSCSALMGNSVDFVHVDFNDNKRVLVWRRGDPGSDNQIIVVANFSDYTSSGGLSGEYIVPGWPALPAGRTWREVTLNRPAPQAGREPIFSWEAKVYQMA